MSAGFLTDWQIERWLEDFSTSWVGIHFDNPKTAGAYASEFFGGAYTRCKTTFSDPSGRATWNSTAIAFAGLPAGMALYLSAWDAPLNGNMRAFGALPGGGYRVAPGGRLDLGVNEWAISFA